MSVQLPIASLSPENITSINELLTIKPKGSFFEMKSRKNPYAETAEKDPVQMFQILPVTREIRIPFRFACGLFGKIFNHGSESKCAHFDPGSFEISLRDYQAGPAMEAYEQLRSHGTTTLGLPPSFGKTILGVWLWHWTKTVVVVLVHRQPLITSWKNSFIKALPKLEKYIWVVGEDYPEGVKNSTLGPEDVKTSNASHSTLDPKGLSNQSLVQKDVKTSSREDVYPPVIICMDGRYEQIPDHIRESVGCVIIDEAHCFCTPSRVGPLLAFQPKFVIAETATLVRPDNMHTMIQCIVGKHSVDRISDKPHTVIRINTGIMAEEKRTRMGLVFMDLCRKLDEDEKRNKMIVDIVVSNPHRKIMILTRIAEHVDTLHKLLSEVGVKSSTYYGSATTYSDTGVLIGTISKIGVGFDEAMSCPDYRGIPSDTLILCNSIKETSTYEQTRGRVMRSKDPYILYLVDENKNVKDHFQHNRGWMTYTNGKIIELDYQEGTIIIPKTTIPQKQ